MGMSFWFVKTLGEQDIVRYHHCTKLPDCYKILDSLIMNHCWYSPVFVVSKLIVTWRWAWAFGLWKHWVSKTLCGINLAQSCLTVLNLLTVYNSIGNHKVISLLEACFDLISSSSLPWKFESWARKLLNIWGSNPSSKRSKKICPFSVHNLKP